MKTKHSLALVALLVTPALVGCSRRDAAASSAPAPLAAEPEVQALAAEAPAGAVGVPSTAQRALIVTMDLTVRVDDVERAVSHLRAEVERAGGYLGEVRLFGGQANMTLRIPRNAVSDVRGSLNGLGTIEADTESTTDVTEEHADLEARLRNARIQEKRILELMSGHAGNIGEVLTAEGELARVRETIERFEAQKRALDSKIDMATLRLTLHPPTAIVQPAPRVEDTPLASIAAAGREGWRVARLALLYAAMLVAAASPFLLPVVLVVGLLVYRSRQRRRAMLSASHG